MSFFWNLSLRRKLIAIIMLVCVSALLFASAGFIAFEYYTTRKALVHDLSSITDVLGLNSRAALRFQDKAAAEMTLASMQAKPNILSASLYTPDRKVFATWSRDPARKDARVELPQEGHCFEGDRLRMFQPVVHDNEKIGYVCLESDLREITDRVRLLAGIVFLVLIIAGLAALGFSAKLQHVFTRPILQLAETARQVSEIKDYSLRAPRSYRDEVGAVIDSFNDMLAQIQSQDKSLQESEKHFRSLIENASDLITIIDNEGRIRYESPSVERILGFTPAELVGRFVLDYIHADDAKDALDQLTQVAQTPGGAASFEFRVKRTDGSWVCLEAKAKNLLADRGVAGIIVNSRDITERKYAEAKLESLHRQLLDTSRQAGMAEVATSVLHNVGNVLNSVNVSVAVMSEKARQSRVANLAKAARLLEEHQNDLAAFFTGDPKGTQLPGYLIRLARHLTEEQAVVVRELQSLTANVEHIKEIVAMQQSYSKVSGVVETLPVVELVEDALRMSAAALARREVRVVREYAEVPPVIVERHKVLQILVNLIRNATYALDDGQPQDKRLTLRVARNGGDSVQVSVIDNGVGIQTENLTRIFELGFTTRKDGHGFGLHSGALAAQELGGALTAHSAGTGQGAVFTLTLPHPPQEGNS